MYGGNKKEQFVQLTLSDIGTRVQSTVALALLKIVPPYLHYSEDHKCHLAKIQ